jgi:hypothetical protein
LGDPKTRDHWEDLGVDERLTLSWTLGREVGIDGPNWIQLSQDRVQWWAFVNTIMNLQFPYKKQDIF